MIKVEGNTLRLGAAQGVDRMERRLRERVDGYSRRRGDLRTDPDQVVESGEDQAVPAGKETVGPQATGASVLWVAYERVPPALQPRYIRLHGAAMITAQWWNDNPALDGALVDVLTYGETESIVRLYDGTVRVVPTNELERRA